MKKSRTCQKHWDKGNSSESGNHSGTFEPSFNPSGRFRDLLNQRGFTREDVESIDEALRECGLRLIATEPAAH